MQNEIQTAPRRFSAPELEKFGVHIWERRHTIILCCNNCNASWSPNLQMGGRLPRGYWKCYRGCNHAARN